MQERPVLTYGARVQRVGGKLRFDDVLAPVGAGMVVGRTNDGAIDLCLPNGGMITVLPDDFWAAFRVPERPVLESDRQLVRRAYSLAVSGLVSGTSLAVGDHSVLCRTARPLPAHANAVTPPGSMVEVQGMGSGSVYYRDMDGFCDACFPSRYLTSEYFTLVAQRRPTAPELHALFEDLRSQIKDRDIVWADLEPQATEYGVRVPEAIAAYWLEHLNDREVGLTALISYLDRLADIFITPPAVVDGVMKKQLSLPREELCALLRGERPHKWRVSLIAIGRVLAQSERYDPWVVEAALVGLEGYRPMQADRYEFSPAGTQG